MAEELADLPTDSVEYAIAAWRRGDTSHLSSFQQDHARNGVFFPKPAELREIANFYLRKQRREEREREERRNEEREARHRAEHPEEYVGWADILSEFYSKRAARVDAPAQPADVSYPDPVYRVLSNLSLAMHGGAEFELTVVQQITEWRLKYEPQRSQV